MDYRYAGSASYPRFDEELYKVAQVFGGVKTEHLKEHEQKQKDEPFGYWFGTVSSDMSENDKFAFPEETNKTLIKWFNHIYDDTFTYEETKEIWEEIKKHKEIKEISRQIWEELEITVENNEGWYIY